MKRSAVRSTIPEPPDFRLVLDENLYGPRIFDALVKHGLPVAKTTDLFPRGSTDEVVLAALHAQPRLYLLTRDSDFRYHAHMRRLIRGANVGVFAITSCGNKTADQLVALIVSAWPGIQRFVAKHATPFSAAIHADGGIAEMK